MPDNSFYKYSKVVPQKGDSTDHGEVLEISQEGRLSVSTLRNLSVRPDCVVLMRDGHPVMDDTVLQRLEDDRVHLLASKVQSGRASADEIAEVCELAIAAVSRGKDQTALMISNLRVGGLFLRRTAEGVFEFTEGFEDAPVLHSGSDKDVVVRTLYGR